MYQIQATVAMEQWQSRLDRNGAAEAGTCFGAKSNAMSTHPDLIPEPRSRTSKRIQKIVKEVQRRTFYIEDLTRSSDKKFLWASQKNFQASTIAKTIFKILMQEPLEEDRSRISTRSSHKDLYDIMQKHLENLTRNCSRMFKIFPQGPAQDHAKASGSIARGSPQDPLTRTFTRSCKDPREDFTRISTRSPHKE